MMRIPVRIQEEHRQPLAWERDTARRTRSESPTEMRLCEAFMGSLMEGLNLMPRPFLWDPLKGSILLMVTLGHDSLRWALEQLLKGYYTQANALSRLAWESWLNGGYLLLHPDRLEEWRDYNKRPKPVENAKACR
jgi:hypothetical protein